MALVAFISTPVSDLSGKTRFHKVPAAPHRLKSAPSRSFFFIAIDYGFFLWSSPGAIRLIRLVGRFRSEPGAPIVTFGYFNQTDAENARALVEKAIVDAVLIARDDDEAQAPGAAVSVGVANEMSPAPISPLPRYLDKWIPQTIFAAPRNSSPRGGASYNNGKAS
jgi:hypothetical protein